MHRYGKRKSLALMTVLAAVLCLLPAGAWAARSVEDVLRSYIEARYPWPQIDVRNIVLSEDMSGKGLPVRIMVIKNPPGRAVFELRYENGKKVVASADVQAFDMAQMSRYSFNKGHVLTGDDIYSTMVNISDLPRGSIRSGSDIIGKTLTRAISPNVPLEKSMLNGSPLVKRGQKVTILVDAPGFRITGTGQLLDNAFVGKYVKVMNLASKKVISGLLVDEGTVEAQF